jgi:hypothetical protein
MLHRIILLTLLSVPQATLAALAPIYQNASDFEVIINFIKTHDTVMETLDSIDFRKFVIHYGDDCKVFFERKEVVRPRGWAGPAEPLEFLSSTCSIQ